MGRSAPRTGSGVYSVRFSRLYRPTWAEIDLKALQDNVRLFSKTVGTRILFVVKADAYGHGAVDSSKAALATGLVHSLGVSSVEEGIVLREAGIKGPILILGSLFPFESVRAAVENDLIPTAASLDGIRRILKAKRGASVSCHLKIDTGMGRIGVRDAGVAAIGEFVRGRRDVLISGAYTHFAKADSDRRFTMAQLSSFLKTISFLRGMGLEIPLVHSANSAAALRFPEARLDLVRPGLALYGLMPGFSPVLSLKSKVVFLKKVPKGAAIGYGGFWRAKRPSLIATVPIGYGDGLPRAASLPSRHPRPFVLLGGRRCPVAGSITMDMTMIDATGSKGVQVGTEAVFIGRCASDQVSADDWASSSASIPYEIVTRLGARIPRLHVESSKIHKNK